MAGHTGVTIGLINNHYVLLPLMAMTTTRMDPVGRIWNRTLSPHALGTQRSSPQRNTFSQRCVCVLVNMQAFWN